MMDLKRYMIAVAIDAAIAVTFKSRLDKQFDDISKLQSGLSDVADRVLDLELRGNTPDE